MLEVDLLESNQCWNGAVFHLMISSACSTDGLRHYNDGQILRYADVAFVAYHLQISFHFRRIQVQMTKDHQLRF